MQTDKVVTRPSRGYLVLGIAPIFCGLNGVFFRYIAGDHRRDLDWIMILAGILILSFAVPLWVYLLTERLEANADGLCRRRFFTTTFNPWSEVADYYRFKQSSTRDYAVKFKDGTIFQMGSDWAGAADFRAAVLRSAPDAERIGEWARLGTRACDQPQTFGYLMPTASRKVGEFFFVFFAGSLALADVAWFILITVAAGHWLIFAITSMTLALAVLLVCYELNDIQAMRRLRDRSFRTDVDGLVVIDGKESVFVDWASIVGYDFTSSLPGSDLRFRKRQIKGHRIRTDSGQEFEFSHRLDRCFLFEEIVRRFAVNAHESRIDWNRSEALGGVAAQWTGGVEGKGDRVFSAWTRTNRMMALMFPVIFVFVGMLEMVLGCFGLTDQPLSVAIGFSIAGVIAGTLAVIALRSVRLLVGTEGIQYCRIWRHDYLPLSDIVKTEMEAKTLIIHRSSGRALQIDTSALNYGSQILPVILERQRLAVRPAPRDADLPEIMPPA